MISIFQTIFPSQQTPLVDAQGRMTNQGMAFWRALWNRTGAATGLQIQVTLAIIAAGTTQVTATSIMADWNQITNTPAGTGVILPVLTGGQAILVANEGLNSLKVYPPTGSQIDALGNNIPYSLASLKLQIYSFFSTTQVYSLQLG